MGLGNLGAAIGGAIGGAMGGPVGGAIGSAIGRGVGDMLSGNSARMVPSQVEAAASGLMQQRNIVETGVNAPMTAIVQQVMGGDIWRGQGANAFASEVSSVVLPQASALMTGITAYNKSLDDARQRMEDADGGPVLNAVVNLKVGFSTIVRF